jgi:DNA-directed RNA polymerase subunit F
MNAFEIFDSDGDGVGDNTDDFPNDASETVDSDGDGVGDNSDAYPNDASQTTDIDSDGDGVSDVNDLCSNTLENAVVDANGCSAMQLDADGDGVEDTVDDFPLDSTQWLDSDGDGYGDNWGDSGWNDSRMSNWTGVFIAGASQSDYCPDIAGNSTTDGYFGCLDTDGNGIADLFEQDETNETDTTNETELPVDTDGDGVSDVEDNCPATSPGTIVDAQGCELDESQDEEESESTFESFFSGDSGAVTTTVGIGAILLALFTLLQTNAAAAILPDTFRWIQVLRKNSKLTKEERNELTYLQSLVQAYHSNPEELAEELVNLKGDITARFTNNQIKKETREKLLILIGELQSSTQNELYQIAHNDAYFGLSEVINTGERTKLLDEKLAMDASEGEQNQSVASPSALGQLDDKGTYWLEWPEGSGTWYYRYNPEDEWLIYQK